MQEALRLTDELIKALESGQRQQQQQQQWQAPIPSNLTSIAATGTHTDAAPPTLAIAPQRSLAGGIQAALGLAAEAAGGDSDSDEDNDQHHPGGAGGGGGGRGVMGEVGGDGIGQKPSLAQSRSEPALECSSEALRPDSTPHQPPVLPLPYAKRARRSPRPAAAVERTMSRADLDPTMSRADLDPAPLGLKIPRRRASGSSDGPNLLASTPEAHTNLLAPTPEALQPPGLPLSSIRHRLPRRQPASLALGRAVREDLDQDPDPPLPVSTTTTGKTAPLMNNRTARTVPQAPSRPLLGPGEAPPATVAVLAAETVLTKTARAAAAAAAATEEKAVSGGKAPASRQKPASRLLRQVSRRCRSLEPPQSVR